MKAAARVVLLGLILATGAGAQAPDAPRALAERVAALEARLERVESLRAIKRLQLSYGHFVEFGLWDDFADLFAADAVAHYPAGDLDKEQVRELFFEQVGQGQLGLADGRLYPHFVLQPVITLDPGGESAHGRWHVLTLLGGLGGNATWVGGVYENDYVRQQGVWKISELRTYTQFSGAYAAGFSVAPRAPAPAAPGGSCENYLVNACTIAFHYDPARVGAPLGEVVAAPAAVAALDLETLAGRARAIERRVERLLDEQAVQNLLWDHAADLFEPGATLELGLRGVYRGQASIRRALEQFGGQGEIAGRVDDHLHLETVVTVSPDGVTASARGIDFAFWGEEADGESRGEWRESVYENTFVKADGIWRIAAMHLYPRFATDYARGWADDARPPPAVSQAYPPDAPPTLSHGVYPEFYIPPFHFANPVTGLPLGYPDGRRPPRAQPAVAAVVSADEQPLSAERLARGLAASERRLAIVLGYDATENLVNAYSFYLDEFDAASAIALFAAGGTRSVRNAAVAGDRELILAAIASERSGGDGRPPGFFALRQALQPVIDVADDGASAQVRLRVLQPVGRVDGGSAWLAGIYTGEARVEDGVWKLDAMTMSYTWAADYETGWASAAPNARIGDVPFHYDNPVSGRERPPAAAP